MTPSAAPNIDELYAAPLDRFIAERDRMARELADAGDKQAAAQVKALRKPSVTAWTLNQMARSETALLRALIATGDDMREALERGDHAAAREAQAVRRARLKEAGDRAGVILETAGHAAAPQVEKIRSVLLQATTDEDVGRAVLEGRLTREPEGDSLPDAFSEAFAASEDTADDRPASSPRVERLARRVEELRAEAEEASQRAAALGREAESARLAADAAEDNARAAERAAERALKHLEKAEAELKTARR